MIEPSTLRKFPVRFLPVLIGILLLPAVAWAHQYLVSSSPSDEAELSVVPQELRMTFGEPVQLGLTEVRLVDPEGGGVALGELRVPPDSSRLLLVDIEGRLGAGLHTVEWRSVGADGHPVQGDFSFEILPDAQGLEPAEEDPEEVVPAREPEPADPGFAERDFDAASPAYVVVRWLLFSALLGIIGALAFRFVVLPLYSGRGGGAPIAELSRGAAGIGMGATGLLLVAVPARLVAQAWAVGGPGMPDAAMLEMLLTGTAWGGAWMLQAVAGVAALIGFVAARRGNAAGWAIAGVSGVVLAFTPGLSGHAVGVEDLAIFAVAADGMHVLAAGAWLGSLFVILLAGIPVARRLEAGRRGPAVAGMVNAFSPAALLFAGVLVLTGGFAAWLQVGSLEALTGTDYGRALLVKLGVFALLLVVAAVNFLRVRPALGDEAGTDRLRRSGGLELVIAVAIVLVTAVLVALPAPR